MKTVFFLFLFWWNLFEAFLSRASFRWIRMNIRFHWWRCLDENDRTMAIDSICDLRWEHPNEYWIEVRYILWARLANWTLRNFTLSNYCSALASVIAPYCIRALFAAHDFDSQIKPFSLARRILIYFRRRVRSHARSRSHRMESKKLINFTNVTI